MTNPPHGTLYTGVTSAIARGSNMKHWPRAWKVRLVLAMNPELRDLYLDLNN
jgi:putative endonuclease